MRLATFGVVYLLSTAQMIANLPDEPPGKSPPTANSGASDKRARREREFEQTLSHTVLKGTWQMTTLDGTRPKAPLGSAKTDRYTIDKVSKASGDYWVISARIQYADKDVTIPVTVRVTWAGDTPIIVLDKMALPGLGTYGARVVIDKPFYAGTWFGVNYGGVLSGEIVKQEDEKKAATTRPAGE